jgi:hypothetical protein
MPLVRLNSTEPSPSVFTSASSSLKNRSKSPVMVSASVVESNWSSASPLIVLPLQVSELNVRLTD